MPTEFRNFARALDRATGAVDAALLRAKQELAQAALARLIDRTPAASGHARANWQVGIGGPATGVVAGADPSGAKTLAKGAAVIAADRDPFATVWISNEAPYIGELEHGSAERAPAGMVATTVAELSRGLRARR